MLFLPNLVKKPSSFIFTVIGRTNKKKKLRGQELWAETFFSFLHKETFDSDKQS